MRWTLLSITLLSTWVAMSGLLPAQSAEESKALPKLLNTIREQHAVPALWAGKFYHDGRQTVGAVGVRKQGEDVKVTIDDRIHLGSCTKAMTAAMVAQLISQDKLSWHTTLGDLFSDVEGFADSDWTSVTVTELLHHRSGAPANAPWSKIHQASPDDAVAARREVVKWLAKQKRPSRPSFLYSNVGYCILGHIVEQIEGQHWQQVVTQRILQPIGITTTGFGPVVGDQALDQPWGHTPPTPGHAIGQAIATLFGGASSAPYQPIQIDNPAPLGPAGRVHMTLRDWAKFVNLYATMDPPDSKLKIEPDDWRELLSAGQEGTYAGGWILTKRQWADGLTLNHNGSNTTWYCVAWVAPKKEFFALVATNCFGQDAMAACDAVAAALVTQDSWVDPAE